ncbi:MAG TPA: DoxX family protein [Steroidobacteraceae bacterium]|nr:DoxX family protein [Steroidobacteraceae bacterium]
MRISRILKYAGLVVVSLFFLIGGQAHFTATPFFVSIVPPYVPFPLAMVYLTGVLELTGAIAIWVPRLRSWAGIGLVALTVCVTPANIYMWMNPQLFPDIGPNLLGWRLVAQVVLLAIIWWSTRPQSAPVETTAAKRIAQLRG